MPLHHCTIAPVRRSLSPGKGRGPGDREAQARFGEKRGYYTDSKTYNEIEEVTGYDRKTIQNFKHVASSIDSSLRKEDVTFGHHNLVTQLSPDKQEQFLTRAAEEKKAALVEPPENGSAGDVKRK